MEQIIEKPIVKVGNSAGVVLPRELLGGFAKVEIIERPLDIEKEIFEILKPYMASLQGIYLVGSYARGEETKESDIDIIAISKDIEKEIKVGKFHIFIYPLEKVIKTLIEMPIILYPRLVEARVILNEGLLEELLRKKIPKASFSHFFEETKRLLKISSEIISLDDEKWQPAQIIYTLFLRLRGVYIIKGLLSGKKYFTKDFIKWLEKEKGVRSVNELFTIYKKVRDEERFVERVLTEDVLFLIKTLKGEVKKYGK